MIVACAKTRRSTAPADKSKLQEIWRVVVLNESVTRMSYAVMVFRKVFGYSEPVATKHMMEVHEKGRSVLWSGNREQAEAYVFALHQWHLTAVIESDEAS